MPLDEQMPEGLEKQFNSHGYGFTSAVIAKCDELSMYNKHFWRMPTPEFPVQINGADTKIDFILRHTHFPGYLIAECKKVDNRYSSWCFFKDPYLNYADGYVCDSLHKDDNTLKHNLRPLQHFHECYNIAFALKKNDGKSEKTDGRDAIEKAVTQLCKGLNGFIQKFKEKKDQLENGWYYFLPVLFTTAKLFVCNANLKETSGNGLLGIKEEDVHETNIVIYNYSQSASIKNSTFVFTPEDLRKYHQLEYIRSIAVVTYEGIEKFLMADTIMNR